MGTVPSTTTMPKVRAQDPQRPAEPHAAADVAAPKSSKSSIFLPPSSPSAWHMQVGPGLQCPAPPWCPFRSASTSSFSPPDALQYYAATRLGPDRRKVRLSEPALHAGSTSAANCWRPHSISIYGGHGREPSLQRLHLDPHYGCQLSAETQLNIWRPPALS